MEDIEGALDSDIVSENSQVVEAIENLKAKEQYANVTENKGPAFNSPGRSGNVIENKSTYGKITGMLRKRKGVIGNPAPRATSISPVNIMTVQREPNGNDLG